ncbi:MAG: TCR/Tet family MFS transporter [Bacteroidetes bacterium]|nr:TCR/Tet family MFS transporter [Bacteroidota bacterium]
MKSNKNSTLIFIIVVVVIDTAGFGLIFPVLPQLLTNLLHSDISTAAKYGGWLSFAYAAMQFVFAPILGNLSDQYGRRPVLLSSLFGFSIDCVFLAFAPNILWLFVGRTIAGIAGASYSVASACVADISTDGNRTKNFGIVNASFGLGFIIGPLIGGTLGQFGTHTPFIVAAILSFINFTFGYFFFPESLNIDTRRTFEWKRANPFGSLKYLSEFPLINTLVLSMIFVSIANHSMESVWAYFTIEKFKWNTSLIGYSLAVIGLLSIVVQLWLVGILAKKLGDRRMAVFGLMLMVTGFFLFAFTEWQWLLLGALLIYIIGGVQGTAVQSITSSIIPDNEQGELQGSLGSLMGLTTLIAPPLMTSSFSYFTRKGSAIYFPGISFLIAALLTLISLILLIKSFKKNKMKK